MKKFGYVLIIGLLVYVTKQLYLHQLGAIPFLLFAVYFFYLGIKELRKERAHTKDRRKRASNS
ncbi:hypothetical protein [Aeribacillus pallidus]|uniref:hypothetical protein n=1 Tax=Aeribacillus pallidus TaxID=33936 RepID=UPI001D4DE325|nr:hypothetical protein [Bacillus sp. (in: firmicutes)]